MAEVAGERSPTAGVGRAADKNAVTARHHRRVAHQQVDFALFTPGVWRQATSFHFGRDQQFGEEFDDVLARLPRRGGYSLALVPAVLRGGDVGESDNLGLPAL